MRPTRIALGIALFCALWFLPLEFRDLIRSDEGRYAEIAREMWVSGNWLTPHLNGIKYFEKPPLQYWATAFFYMVLGASAWTARLWPALTGFAGLFLSGWFGFRFVSLPVACFATFVQASTLWYLGIAHFNVLDMGLCFFLQLTLFGYLLRLRCDDEKKLAAWMMGLGIAGAVLSKGLVGIVLPGTVFIVDSIWHRDGRAWRWRFQLSVWSIAFIFGAPWFIWVSIKNPEFPYFFFIHEHFQRFTTEVHHRDAPIYYFIPILFAGLLPWTFLWLKSLKTWPGILTGEINFDKRLQRVLIVWSVFIFAFFSVSHSKLPSYILPIFPALSWLLAFPLSSYPLKEWRASLVGSIMLWVGLVVVVPYIPAWLPDDGLRQLFHRYLPYLFATVVLMVLGCAILLWKERSLDKCQDKNLTMEVWGGVVLIWSLAVQIALQGHQVFSPRMSVYSLVEQIVKVRGEFRKDVPFYSVDTYEQTLPFYIHRTTTLVNFFDEMDFGCKQEPHLCIKKMETWQVKWLNEPQNAYAIMPPALYTQLSKLLPMHVLGQNSRSVIVQRY